MTPIFWRNWLVKIMHVLLALTTPVSLRSAWLMNAPATDVAVTHLALDFGARHQRRHAVDHHHIHGVGRTSASAISSACSPVSGWLT